MRARTFNQILTAPEFGRTPQHVEVVCKLRLADFKAKLDRSRKRLEYEEEEFEPGSPLNLSRREDSGNKRGRDESAEGWQAEEEDAQEEVQPLGKKSRVVVTEEEFALPRPPRPPSRGPRACVADALEDGGAAAVAAAAAPPAPPVGQRERRLTRAGRADQDQQASGEAGKILINVK